MFHWFFIGGERMRDNKLKTVPRLLGLDKIHRSVFLDMSLIGEVWSFDGWKMRYPTQERPLLGRLDVLAMCSFVLNFTNITHHTTLFSKFPHKTSKFLSSLTFFCDVLIILQFQSFSKARLMYPQIVSWECYGAIMTLLGERNMRQEVNLISLNGFFLINTLKFLTVQPLTLVSLPLLLVKVVDSTYEEAPYNFGKGLKLNIVLTMNPFQFKRNTSWENELLFV